MTSDAQESLASKTGASSRGMSITCQARDTSIFATRVSWRYVTNTDDYLRLNSKYTDNMKLASFM